MDEKTRDFLYEIAPATVATIFIIVLMLMVSQAQNEKFDRMQQQMQKASVACGKQMVIMCWGFGGNVTNLTSSAGFNTNLSCSLQSGLKFSVDCSFGG